MNTSFMRRLGVLVVAAAAAVYALSSVAVREQPARTREHATTAQAPTLVSSAAVRSPESESQRPHPISAEREHIQHENQLIGALNDAVDLHDIAGLRRLIARYRELDPSDEQRLQAGYERIADCLQAPGEASRTSAQAYYDRERASTLRRYVRRACLE